MKARRRAIFLKANQSSTDLKSSSTIRLFPPPCDSSINQDRLAKLMGKIAIAIMHAHRDGKKMLLVLGENHYEAYSQKVILEIMSLCQAIFGIKNVAIEYDNMESFHNVVNNPTCQLEGHNASEYLSFMTKYLWKMIPIDKHFTCMYDRNIRDDGMVEELISDKISNHLICILGTNHIAGLGFRKNLLKDKYEIIFVNTCDSALIQAYPSSIEATLIKNEANCFQLTNDN